MSIVYTETYWQDVKKVADQIPGLSEIYNKTVLVTGGTGMICSTVAEILFYLNNFQDAGITILLAGRDKQRVCNRFYCFDEGKDYQFIQYDATCNQKLDVDVDYIIHGASNANPQVYVKQPVETMLSNIVGLNCLLDLAKRKHCKRVLYISSSEVYGIKKEERAYVEDDYGFVDILNARACYPNSKRTAETLCIAYREEYKVNTVIVRPGHIYGPTITDIDSRASAQFTRNAMKGQDIIMKSEGNQLRSYCYTLDCASAILTVLLNGEIGNAYNISNKNSVITIRELAETFARVSKSKVVYENATDFEKKGYNLMENSALNAEKLEALGWRAHFDVLEGVSKTICMLK